MPEATQANGPAAATALPVKVSTPELSERNEEQAAKPVAAKVSTAVATALNPDRAAEPMLRIPLAPPSAAQVKGESAVLPVQE